METHGKIRHVFRIDSYSGWRRKLLLFAHLCYRGYFACVLMLYSLSPFTGDTLPCSFFCNIHISNRCPRYKTYNTMQENEHTLAYIRHRVFPIHMPWEANNQTHTHTHTQPAIHHILYTFILVRFIYFLGFFFFFRFIISRLFVVVFPLRCLTVFFFFFRSPISTMYSKLVVERF